MATTSSISQFPVTKDNLEGLYSTVSAFPPADSSHVEKVRHILSLSDCKDYSTIDILTFDPTRFETVQACCRIVQNIKHQYRWNLVEPTDLATPYTTVTQSKRKSTSAPRPMNSFIIWSQPTRKLMVMLCPNMKNDVISCVLGKAWREKSKEELQMYAIEKEKLHKFHSAEFPVYKFTPKTKATKSAKLKNMFDASIQFSQVCHKQSPDMISFDPSTQENTYYNTHLQTPPKHKSTPWEFLSPPEVQVYPLNTRNRNISALQPTTVPHTFVYQPSFSTENEDFSDLDTIKLDRLGPFFTEEDWSYWMDLLLL